MFNPLKQMGDQAKMVQEAMKIQKELQKEEITIEKHGVKVVMSGTQEVIAIEVNGKRDQDVRDALNEAIKKSQEAAAKKLRQMGGGLGGLLGGM